MIAPNEPLAGRPTAGGQVTLGEIERNASIYAQSRARLSVELDGLREELEAVKKRRIKEIKQRAANAAEDEARLRSLVEGNPHLFEKPKTITLHGIKCGYRTSNGRIVFADGDMVVKLIKKHLGEKEDILVRKFEEVNKNALKTLTGPELAKIGCSIEGAGEQVVVAAADDEVDKLVGKLIQDMVDVILEEERGTE